MPVTMPEMPTISSPPPAARRAMTEVTDVPSGFRSRIVLALPFRRMSASRISGGRLSGPVGPAAAKTGRTCGGPARALPSLCISTIPSIHSDKACPE